MKSSSWVLSLVVLFLAISWTFDDILFCCFIPNDLWEYLLLPSEEVHCPGLNEEDFSRKLRIPQTVQVSSHMECVQKGRELGLPLLCEGMTLPLSQEELLESYLSDSEVQELYCFNLSRESTITENTESYLNGTFRDVHDNPELRGRCHGGFVVSDHHQEFLNSLNLIENVTMQENMMKPQRQPEQFHLGSTFFGVYDTNLITTTDHAGLLETMVYQLVGEKIWILHDRRQSSNRHHVSTAFNPFPKCGQEYWNNVDEIWLGHSRPGTYLYFPFSWQHTVFAKQGANLMTSFRMAGRKFVFNDLRLRDRVQLILRYRLKGIDYLEAVPSHGHKSRSFILKANRLFKDSNATAQIKRLVIEKLDVQWD